MSIVKEHFDEIALNYDYWKQKNWYYYQNIKEIISEIVPKNAEVLELGCGTGDILAFIEPELGVGIDLSPKMIEIAKSKYENNNNLQFYVSDKAPDRNFEFILMIDVIEHLEDRKSFFKDIQKYCKKESIIVLLMANPMWEPLLLLLEKLNLKMPEGLHYRITYTDLKNELEELSFEIVDHKYRQLFPLNLGILSKIINRHFYNIPLIRKLGVTEILIIKQRSGS